jgi:hypothetical protein
MSSYGNDEVEAETKKKAHNDAAVIAYTLEVAHYGATSVRGTEYEAKRAAAVIDAAKNVSTIAIIDA